MTQKYRIGIKGKYLYITPRPKKDVEGGIVLVLSEPRQKGLEPYMAADIKAGRKKYDLPSLPKDIWIIRAFIKP